MSATDPENDVTAADLLGSELRFPRLLDGETPVAAFVIVKTLDADGDTGWAARESAGSNRHEWLSTLISYTDARRREEADGWVTREEASDAAAPPTSS